MVDNKTPITEPVEQEEVKTVVEPVNQAGTKQPQAETTQGDRSEYNCVPCGGSGLVKEDRCINCGGTGKV